MTHDVMGHDTGSMTKTVVIKTNLAQLAHIAWVVFTVIIQISLIGLFWRPTILGPFVDVQSF